MNMKQATGLGRRTASGLFTIGAALALCFGVSFSAQAQTCVVSNWQDVGDVSGLTDADAGTQGSSNRRYGGPCGLRVPFGSTPAWVENSFQQGTTTPLDEPVYIARFYAFLDNLSGTEVPIFEAYNSSDAAVFTVFYSDSGNLGFDANGDTTIDQNVSVGNGWHSVEIVYDADGDSFTISVDGATDIVLSPTLSDSVAAVRMGDIDGAGGGTADFDDFDSRRVDRPGRLMVGDGDASGAITISDLFAVETERTGGDFAPGQPDCDESGTITISDLFCIEAIRTGGS